MVYNIKNRKGKVIAGKTKAQNNTYIGTQITTVSTALFTLMIAFLRPAIHQNFILEVNRQKLFMEIKLY